MINKVVVGIADMKTSDSSDDIIVTYALGSCIGLAAYDPIERVGGLIHIMLPFAIDETAVKQNPFMFADPGLPLLFKALYKKGAKKENLIIKIAGGASLLQASKTFRIGEKNCIFVKDYLKNNGFTLKAESVGGTYVRTMKLAMKTGRVWIRIPGLGSAEL